MLKSSSSIIVVAAASSLAAPRSAHHHISRRDLRAPLALSRPLASPRVPSTWPFSLGLDVAASSDASADPELSTMAEKEAWLARARGVEIESPAERRGRGRGRRERAPPGPRRGRDAPGQVRAHSARRLAPVRAARGDPRARRVRRRRRDVLRPTFAGRRRDRSARRANRRCASSASKGLRDLPVRPRRGRRPGRDRDLRARARPSDTNGHRGVYLYLDEVGLLKNLPAERARVGAVRARAAVRRATSGATSTKARGRPNPPPRTTSSAVDDLDSQSAWRAGPRTGERRARPGHGQRPGRRRQRRGLWSAAAARRTTPGGAGEGFAWTQTDDEVELSVARGGGAGDEGAGRGGSHRARERDGSRRGGDRVRRREAVSRGEARRVDVDHRRGAPRSSSRSRRWTSKCGTP